MKRAMAAGREAIVAYTPTGVRRRLGPLASHLHMLVFDHLWIRTVYPNRAALDARVWRSAQPLPHQLKRLQRQGIRTIINLRGRTKTSTYHIEKAACSALGLNYVELPLKSREPPSREVLRAAHALIRDLDGPTLLHCKSGADRAGLMSALYLHWKRGIPVDVARRQLSLRFGHIAQADTGVLDAFFDRYLADTAVRPMSLLDWIETVYDPVELQRSFRSRGWANRVVTTILKRE
jgi:protein tyrosine phosphatase (PTP) superfamily phosphohydrolase (DUF442 family)